MLLVIVSSLMPAGLIAFALGNRAGDTND